MARMVGLHNSDKGRGNIYRSGTVSFWQSVELGRHFGVKSDTKGISPCWSGFDVWSGKCRLTCIQHLS